MNERLSFVGRLAKVIIPTRLQVLLCVSGSLAVMVVLEGASILYHFGVSSTDISTSQDQLRLRFDSLSHSVLASNIALVGFWSVVGLVAYLICWAGYNFIVEARNEVTLETRYENLGTHHGPWGTLGIKVVAAIGLLAVILSFKSGLNLAVSLFSPVIDEVTAGTILAAIAGIIVLAFMLYLVLVFLELTLSAWYRPEAFTD